MILQLAGSTLLMVGVLCLNAAGGFLPAAGQPGGDSRLWPATIGAVVTGILLLVVAYRIKDRN